MWQIIDTFLQQGSVVMQSTLMHAIREYSLNLLVNTCVDIFSEFDPILNTIPYYS